MKKLLMFVFVLTTPIEVQAQFAWQPRAELPPWTDSMSDGCSVPRIAARAFLLTPEQAQHCVEHDRRYYYGGTIADRLRADLLLALGWLNTDMPPHQVEVGLRAIRLFGGPARRQPYSWAFGDRVFAYLDKQDSETTEPARWPKTVTFGAMLASGGADLYATGVCLGAGRCREMNKALSWAAGKRAPVFGVTKMVGTGVVMWLVDWLYDHGHEKLALIIGWGAAGSWTWAAVRGARYSPFDE